MDYTSIIKRAWAIVWANKWLFILGFLAALGSGGSSGSGSNFNTGSGSGGDLGLPSDFAQTISDIVPFIIAGACFLILLGIGLWLLRLIGEAGMIASVDRIEMGEKLSFGDGFRAGAAHLKSMVGLSLVLYGPFVLVGILIAGAFFVSIVGAASSNSDGALAGLGVFGLCLIPVVCLLAIAGIVVNFVYPMAQRSIIIQKMGIMDGIRNGWQVLRTNLGEIFVLGIIFFLIGLVVGFVSLIVAVPLAVLFVLPVILAAIQGGQVLTAASVILGIIGLIVFILLVAAISSIVRTLQSASFTLAFHQWIGKKKAVTV